MVKYGMILSRKGRRFREFDAKPSTTGRIRLWRHYSATPEPLGTRRYCLTAKTNVVSTASRASWRHCSLSVSRLVRCTSVNVSGGFPSSSQHHPYEGQWSTGFAFANAGFDFSAIIKPLRSHPFLLPCGTRRAELSSNSPRSAERVDCSVQVI